MLRLTIESSEYFEEETGLFKTQEAVTVNLEHSLLAMSRWEGETKKCFLASTLDVADLTLYVQCMSEEYISLDTAKNILFHYKREIIKYIYDDRVAKKATPYQNERILSGNRQSQKQKFTPTEEIYYVMDELGIPWAAEKWHFSRLSSLIKQHSKKKGGKKGSGKRMSAANLQKMERINQARLNGGV